MGSAIVTDSGEVDVSKTSEVEDAPGHLTSTGSPSRLDRRQAFRWALGATGLSAVVATLTACDMVTDTEDPQVHLFRRATYGLNGPGLVHLRTIGTAAWLDEQLDPARLDTSAVDAKVAALPQVTMGYGDLRAAVQAQQDTTVQIRLATVIRQVESPAQLFERMVELWSDHLNAPIYDRRSGALKAFEDRTVIRPLALGRFADLLVASAKSPNMLRYLDNATNRRQGPNENYARELLELHTVGVGNFTEDDVAATARLLTGWTFNPEGGQFVFNGSVHDAGSLSILDWTRPAGGSGLADGEAFLVHLARHPATARTIATKLAQRFVTDQPPARLVDDLSAVYLANDTGITPVLRALFAHPGFDAAMGAKFRRPLDWFTSSVRATSGTIAPAIDQRAGRLVRLVGGLGQLPFGWPAPNGFPDVEGAWLTSGGLLARWNLAGDLMAGSVPLVVMPLGALRAGIAGLSTTDALATLASRILHETLTPTGTRLLGEHSGLANVARLNATQASQLVDRIVPMMLATPDFQYR